ncbi:hypothetical protein BMS3Abin04_02201 [bacterium BMS3Abin04]|nr:hypothetical protein BMS3Abin04_02201 [bacterium BMS3Abin04]
MKQTLLFIIIIISFVTVNGQEFNKNIDKDSLLQIIVKELPTEKKDEFLKIYKEGNEESKEFLLFMYSMPRSSKKELIENFDKNKDSIFKLQTEFSKLVPDSLIVFIEFNPKNIIVNTEESIDLKIYGKSITQEWNLEYDSDVLNEMIKSLGWNSDTLQKIKTLLDNANCISIENGETTTIGFARSGMGKYSYKIFKTDLTDEQKSKYNDSCMYFFYKDNIVLEYGGGAIGPQCFPDE